MKARMADDSARKLGSVASWCVVTQLRQTHWLQLGPWSAHYSYTPGTQLLHIVGVYHMLDNIVNSNYDGTPPKVYVWHHNRNTCLIHGHPGKQMGCFSPCWYLYVNAVKVMCNAFPQKNITHWKAYSRAKWEEACSGEIFTSAFVFWCFSCRLHIQSLCVL